MISVIIPVHNESAYLPLLLRALAEQKVNCPYEVVVVDNNSQDDVIEATKPYVQSMSVRVFACEQLGRGIARNMGANNALGDIFVFLDADNLIGTGFLEEVYQNTMNNRYEAGYFTTKPIERSVCADTLHSVLEVIKRFGPRPFGKNFCSRELFYNVGGYNENISIGTNVDFLSRLKKQLRMEGKRLGRIQNPVYRSMRRFKKYGYRTVLSRWLCGYLGLRNITYPPYNSD